jgi:IS5 family transposase
MILGGIMKKIKHKEELAIPGLAEHELLHSKQKLARLEKSWAGVFRQHILPYLPVEKMSRFYSDSMGRQSKELYALFGAVVLQEVFDLNDEKTVEELAFSEQWHFALDCYDERDHLICERTLYTMRFQIQQLELWDKIFNKVTHEMITCFGVDVSKQRLDSVHVYSNMARLGRIRLMSLTVSQFLRNLKRQSQALFSTIPLSVIEKYGTKKETSYFGQVKPSDSEKTLQSVAEDMYLLKTSFESNEIVISMKSFKLLQRVFSEQCTVEGEEVKVKAAKEVAADSVQNPSDPDAGYDRHKGQGYQTQIMETYSKSADENAEPKLNLITYVHTESASEHDSKALEPALENLRERGIACKKALADTLYSSAENVELAKEYGVELIGPTPGKKAAIGNHPIEINETTYEITACPAGHSPNVIKHSKKGMITVIWHKATCATCCHTDSCPFKSCKKGRKHYYKKESMRTHLRRIYEESQEFKEEYRYRSGIEGTISRFIPMTGARRSRYRGESKMQFSQTLKALGINMFRVTNYKRKLSKNPPKASFSFFLFDKNYFFSQYCLQNWKYAA